MGLEPIRLRHTPLKRACLPIPALPHFQFCFRFIQATSLYYQTLIEMSMLFLKFFAVFSVLFFAEFKNPFAMRFIRVYRLFV